jgi:hypothetical protein
MCELRPGQGLSVKNKYGEIAVTFLDQERAAKPGTD